MADIKHLTSTDFQETIAGGKPVLVDFWAPWCGPCKQIAPVLEELAGEVGDKIVIAKVNVDDNPDIASQYNVRGIPTMVLFKDGKAADQLVGFSPKEALAQWIDERI